MNLKIKVNTTHDDFIINQTVDLVNDEISMSSRVSEIALRLQDEGIRNALIELGWKPPDYDLWDS